MEEKGNPTEKNKQDGLISLPSNGQESNLRAFNRSLYINHLEEDESLSLRALSALSK